MNYGLDGQMLTATEPDVWAGESIVSEQNITPGEDNISAIRMLEMENEMLTEELDESRNKSASQAAECDKHLAELKASKLELLDCYQKLRELEQRLQAAFVEAKEKQIEAEVLRNQMLQYKKAVCETEQQQNLQGFPEAIGDIYQQTLFQSTSRVGADEPVTERASDAVSELAKLKVELAKGQERCDSLQTEISDQQDLSVRRMKVLEKEHEQQRDRLKSQIKALEKKLHAASQDSRQRRQVVQDGTVAKEVEELRRYFRDVKNREAKMIDDKEKLEKQLDSRDGRIAALTQEIRTLEAKNKRIPSLASKLSQLQSTHEEAKIAFAGDIEKINKTLANSQIRNGILAANFEKEAQANITLKKETDRSAKKISYLETEKTRLESLVARLEQTSAQRSPHTHCHLCGPPWECCGTT